MADLVRGMRHFHVCSMGSCKKPGFYATKNGCAYCEKCTIKYVIRYGVSDFWPHHIPHVIEITEKYS